jgi:hypothetical protein
MSSFILFLLMTCAWAELPIDRPMYEYEKNLKNEIQLSLERFYEGKVQVSVFLTIKSVDVSEKSVSQTLDIGYMPTPVVVKSKNGIQGKMIQRIDVHTFIHKSENETEKQDILNIIRSAAMPYTAQINVSFKVRTITPTSEFKKTVIESTLMEKIQKKLIEESGRLYDLLQVLLVLLFIGVTILFIPSQIKSIVKAFFENKGQNQQAFNQLQQKTEKATEALVVLDQSHFLSFKEVMFNFPKSFRHFFLNSDQEEKNMLIDAISLLTPNELQKIKPFIHDLLGEVESHAFNQIDFKNLNSWLEKVARSIIIRDTVDRKLLEDFIPSKDFERITVLNFDDMLRIGHKLNNPSVWTVLSLSRGADESAKILAELHHEMRLKIISNPDFDLELINQAVGDIMNEIAGGSSKGISKISTEIIQSFSLMLESKSDDEADIILKAIRESDLKLFENLNRLYWPINKISTLDFNFVKSLFNELDIKEKTSLFIGVNHEIRDIFLKSADKKLQIILVDAFENQQKQPSLEVKKQSQLSARNFIKKCQKLTIDSSVMAA